MSGTPSAPPDWTFRGLARALSIGLFAVGTGALAGYVVSHEARPGGADRGASPEGRPSAGPVELAVVAPLHRGSALVDYLVEHVGPIGAEGQVSLECRRGGARARLDIARLAPGAPEPPAKAGPYAIYYGNDAPPGDGVRLALALADVIGKNLSAPVPRGLRPLSTPGR